MTTLKTYLLTLGLLLLSGYTCICAVPQQRHVHHSPVQAFELSDHAFSGRKIGFNTSKFITPESDKDEDVQFCSEEKEEEHHLPLSQRTYIQVGRFLPGLYAKVSVTFRHSIEKHLWFLMHWFYASSNRSIVLRVIRI